MSDHLELAVNTLVERFGAEAHEFRQQKTLVLSTKTFLAALQTLRDELAFNMLMDLTAVDYLDQEPRFHLVYQLFSMEKQVRLSLRVPVNGSNPHLSTAEKIYPSANWYEREIWDMFGIQFDNHSDPRRILMPADWQGHPLRKDYPLGYEEVQFTFNFNDISQRKPKGKEFQNEEAGHD